MSTLATLRMLVRYTRWANQTLFNALKSLPLECIMEERKTGAGSLIKTIGHIYVVDQIWKGHLLDQKHGYQTRNITEVPPLDILIAMQLASDDWYRDYADQINVSDHDEPICFEFVDGGNGQMTRGEMLLHIINHKTYHRGYIAQMMYESSYRPPAIDLPVFLRDVPQVEIRGLSDPI